MKKIKSIVSLFIVLFLVGITFVYAGTNDSTLVKHNYDNIYAVYDGTDRIHLFYAQRYTLNGLTSYCIEPAVAIDTNIYSSTTDWSITGLNEDVREYVKLVAYYGYDYTGHNNMKYYLASQELIWEKITGRETYWVSGASADSPRVDVNNEKKLFKI